MMKAKTPILTLASCGYKCWQDERYYEQGGRYVISASDFFTDSMGSPWWACHRILARRVPEVENASKIRLHIETNRRGKTLIPDSLPALEMNLEDLIIPFLGKRCKAWVEIVEWKNE